MISKELPSDVKFSYPISYFGGSFESNKKCSQALFCYLIFVPSLEEGKGNPKRNQVKRIHALHRNLAEKTTLLYY
jgi:hypothetical protein